MNSFNQSKKVKKLLATSLVIIMSLMGVGCFTGPVEKASSRENLDTILYSLGAMERVGIMPRARTVPVTSGEVPFGFLAEVQEDSENISLGILVGFKDFSQDEINQTSNLIIPILMNMIQQSFNAQVTRFNPNELAAAGLPDSEAVHQLVLNSLIGGMDLYMRCYTSKVLVLDESNIRLDCYAWAPGFLQDGQYLFRIEFLESLLDQLLQLS